VTERDANRIQSLPLDVLGRPRAPVVTASVGATPFGFGFGPQGELIVSEAGASTVSSYTAPGRRKRTRVPTAASSSQIRPPCASTIAREIASPSPAPVSRRDGSAR
jgi:hypothetical protein